MSLLQRFLHRHTTPDSLWRDGNFLRIFSASTLSVLGTAVTQMALPLTAVQLLHASATEMGILIACQLLPFVLLGLPAGVWIDRSKKRPLAIAFDLLAAAALLIVPLAWWSGWLSMGVLYAVAFLVKTQEAIGGSALQVFVTHLVGRERLVLANSKLWGANSAAMIVGPALGALLVASFGAPFALVFDAASFIASAWLVSRVRFDEPLGTGPRRSVWHEAREGLQRVWHTPVLRHLVWVVCLWIALNDGFNALYVLFASRELGLDAGGIAIINTMGAMGGLCGAVVAHRLERRFGIRVALVAGVSVAALGYLLYALPTRELPHVAWLAGCAMMIVDAGAAVYVVNYLSLRQAVTPDALLGRVVTSMRFLSILPTPFATVMIGRSGDVNGLTTTLLGIGIGTVLLALLAMRFLPHHPPVPAAASAAD